MNRHREHGGGFRLSAGLQPVLTGKNPLRAADRPASARSRPRYGQEPIQNRQREHGGGFGLWARPAVFLFLLAVVATLVAGCAPAKPSEPTTRPIRIGLSMDSFVVERWVRDRDIFVSEAQSLGAQVLVQVANEDHDTQVEQIKALVAQGIDVLVVVPNDSTRIGPTVRMVRDRGIPVISYDRLILRGKSDLYIAHDHVGAGKLMGEAVAKAVARYKVSRPFRLYIVNGARADHNSELMNQGFHAALAPLVEAGRLKVVQEVWLNAWSSEEAESAFRGALDTHGLKPDGVIAANDMVAESLIRVLSQRSLLDGTLVTGMDADLAACQRVVEGIQTMTVYKPIVPLARTAAQYATKMAKGESPGVMEFISDGEFQVPYVKLQAVAVDKTNMRDVIIREGFHRYEEVYRDQRKEL